MKLLIEPDNECLETDNNNEDHGAVFNDFLDEKYISSDEYCTIMIFIIIICFQKFIVRFDYSKSYSLTCIVR